MRSIYRCDISEESLPDLRGHVKSGGRQVTSPSHVGRCQHGPAARTGDVGPTLRAVRRHVDYALARRAVLRDLRAGRRERLDVCDAHPELVRAGTHIGEPAGGDCPVCGSADLRLVSYVYGDKLRAANGRCISSPTELAKLDARHEEFSCYVVEASGG